MGDKTGIEWSDATWNPVTGCSKVSSGCNNCYAQTFTERWRGTPGHPFENGFDITLRPERLEQPLRWKKPRKIFVNSLSDLFHDAVPDEYIAQVFDIMGAASQHTFQILTKRHGRMRSLLQRWTNRTQEYQRPDGILDGYPPPPVDRDFGTWPLPNVWLGVSVENQKTADLRIPALLETPAAVRWISAEPLLGAIDLKGAALRPYERQQGGYWEYGTDPYGADKVWKPAPPAQLDWVVVGGESGRGARPMHPEWARHLRDQCTAAHVPFLFKQHGEYIPVTIEDDPQFAGGRAYQDPRGGRSALVIREPAPPHRHFEGGLRRPMEPGDQTRGGVVMLDHDTVMVRVGKKAAGRELDGRIWDEFPEA